MLAAAVTRKEAPRLGGRHLSLTLTTSPCPLARTTVLLAKSVSQSPDIDLDSFLERFSVSLE